MAAKLPISHTMKLKKETVSQYSLQQGNSACQITGLYVPKMWLSEVDEIKTPVDENSEFEVTLRRTK